MLIRVGSRASKLSVAQTEYFVAKVKAAFDGDVEVETHKITTSGDRLKDINLSSIGGKGLFVKELEEALLMRKIDVAVNSLKDIPSVFDDRLIMGCFLQREDPRDVFVSKFYNRIEDVPKGERIGTSSPRRECLLRQIGLNSILLRGNVDSRLAKAHDYPGIILAFAGLRRLGLSQHASQVLEPEIFLPAVGQGIVSVQLRKDDIGLMDMLAKINHKETEACASTERAMLKAIGGNCFTPMAGLATIGREKIISLRGMLLKNGKVRYASASGTVPEDIGREVGTMLLAS